MVKLLHYSEYIFLYVLQLWNIALLPASSHKLGQRVPYIMDRQLQLLPEDAR